MQAESNPSGKNVLFCDHSFVGVSGGSSFYRALLDSSSGVGFSLSGGLSWAPFVGRCWWAGFRHIDLIASASPWMSRSVIICSPPSTRLPTCPLIAGWTRPRWVPFQISQIRLLRVAWSPPIIHEKKRWKQFGHEPRQRSDRETRQRFSYPFTRYPPFQNGDRRGPWTMSNR